MLNEEDLVPSGLFSSEPDKERRGFFEELARSVYPTKLAALVAAPTVPKNLYQETSENLYQETSEDISVIPVNSVLTTTACKFDWIACTGRNFMAEVQDVDPQP